MDVSVLILSCDKYADLWQPFLSLFWQNWPDCPYTVYLGANERSYNDPRINMIHVGDDSNWSTGLIKMLNRIETDYVLITLEDFFLRTPVNTDNVRKALDFLIQSKGHTVKLIPNPKPLKNIRNVPFGEFEIKQSYRVNLQAAIWRTSTLRQLLRNGESAWEFEVNATKRAEQIANGFYGVYSPILTYKHHVVEKGKWFRNEARYFRRQNIGCDFSAREIMSTCEMLHWRWNKQKNKIKQCIKSALRNPQMRLAELQ